MGELGQAGHEFVEKHDRSSYFWDFPMPLKTIFKNNHRPFL